MTSLSRVENDFWARLDEEPSEGRSLHNRSPAAARNTTDAKHRFMPKSKLVIYLDNICKDESSAQTFFETACAHIFDGGER